MKSKKQLTTLGQNITALEVDGTFDDCQAMVKKAFVDQRTIDHMQLTCKFNKCGDGYLNYFFLFAYKTLKQKEHDIVFSIPSGNFEIFVLV